MFLDETGITTNLLRRYGRAPRGARVHDHAPCGRWQTSTFLAALRVTGLTRPVQKMDRFVTACAREN